MRRAPEVFNTYTFRSLTKEQEKASIARRFCSLRKQPPKRKKRTIMGDDRTITDCEHYMRGNCRWGHECLFRHPTYLHEPQIVCKFWQTYSCTNKFCQYLHPAVLPPTHTSSTFKSKTPLVHTEKASKIATVCAYFMSGRCSKPACPFLHSIPEATSTRHPQQSFTTPGQKRQAPDILSKYSLRHLVEETEAEATNRKLVELDKKLESYHKGAISVNGVTDDDPDVVLLAKKSKIDT